MNLFGTKKRGLITLVAIAVLLLVYMRSEITPYVDKMADDNAVERLADINPEEIFAVDQGKRGEKLLEKAFQFAVGEVVHVYNEKMDGAEYAAPRKPQEKVYEDVQEVETIEENIDEEVKEQVVRYEFRNEALLQEHFEKHGAEFPYDNELDYLIGANLVVDNKNALHKFEKEDGDDVYYLEKTNEFVIVSKDGYIRTYFKPSKGKQYFNRQ